MFTITEKKILNFLSFKNCILKNFQEKQILQCVLFTLISLNYSVILMFKIVTNIHNLIFTELKSIDVNFYRSI